MTVARRFARLVDSALGAGPPEGALAVQRANVLAAARRLQREPARVRWELAAGAVLACAAAIALVVVATRGPTPFEVSFRGSAAPDPGTLLVASTRAETLEFSDGSRVVLEPNARASLVRLDPTRADLALQEGRIAASIQHREGVTWSIAAGPYRVRVVGTKLSVDWERASSTLRVSVSEGLVRITGGDLGAEGVDVSAGERLERRPAQAESAPPARAGTTEPAPALPAPVVAPRPSAEREAGIGELAQAGKYKEALALAERRGFDVVVSELGEEDLMALGNAARYSGSGARARQAMLALRQRFPGRPAAELAAFYLARIAEQLERNPNEAARWLRVFLRESPSGSLAADARANLISLLLAAGDKAGARAVAVDYLEHHPQGAIAEQARSLVERTESR